jgi:hypothetical protein
MQYEKLSEDNLLDDLDTSWIEEYTRLEKIDKNYSREPMKNIHVFFVYINSRSEIETVEQIVEPLEEGDTTTVIKNSRLLQLIQSKKKYTPTTKYKLKTILLFNVLLEPENIQDYSHADNYQEITSPFLKEVSLLNDIKIEPSIFIFHDMNSLYLLFTEKELALNGNNVIKSILKNTTSKHVPDGSDKKMTKKVRISETPIKRVIVHSKTKKSQKKEGGE